MRVSIIAIVITSLTSASYAGDRTDLPALLVKSAAVLNLNPALVQKLITRDCEFDNPGDQVRTDSCTKLQLSSFNLIQRTLKHFNNDESMAITLGCMVSSKLVYGFNWNGVSKCYKDYLNRAAREVANKS
jgi:hypothetical protein